MNGRIWVESEPETGSTFLFTAAFPVPKQTSQKIFAPTPDLEGMRVVVDDNATSREILSSMLASFSFEVSVAASGQEGIDMLKDPQAKPYKLILMDWNMPGMDGLETSRRIRTDAELAQAPTIITVTVYGREEYQAVLMDVQMPEMDGYEATREIRKDQRFRDLPIIAMTANAMAGDREKSLEAGMNDHVAKPIAPRELFETLSRWIEPGAWQTDTDDTPHDAGRATESPLPEVAGINMELGLSRVAGNKKLYRELLQKFQRDFTSATQEIKAALAADDKQTAQRLAHTVKGVAGNIGAEALAQAATELDALFKEVVTGDREAHTAKSVVLAFDAALAQLLAALEGLPADEVQVPDSAAEQLCDSLEKLGPNLRKRQPRRCLPILDQIAAYTLPPDCVEQIDDLRQLINRYKFKEAQAVFDTLIQKLHRWSR